jgi:predicted component of type VI protein secretion system
MKSLTVSPRVVLAAITALAAVVIITFIGGSHWKWWNALSVSIVQTHQAVAEPAALKSTITPEAVAPPTVASTPSVVQSQPKAPNLAETVAGQTSENVAGNVSGGASGSVLAQAAGASSDVLPTPVKKKTLAI